MTRSTRLLTALAFAAPALAAQNTPPRMTDVMSPAEMRETGVASLTPAQRTALDAWLARYTAIVERAASNGAQAAAGNNAAQAPNETYAGPAAGLPYGSRIADVLDGGTKIVLADGTIWEVNLPDRPSTTRWQKGDYVIVAARAIQINNVFFFELINGRDGTQAAVAWRGKN
jgi:hypothetical protein